MSYSTNLDSQHLKGDFKRVTVINNGGIWQAQGDVPGGSQNLSGPPTDLASAKTAAETYVTGLGYLQISYWADWSSTQSKSLWFLPA